MKSLLLITICSLVLIPFASAQANALTTVGVTTAINQYRVANKLMPLAENPILDKIAQTRVDQMLREGWFAHISPSGQAPWSLYYDAGYWFDWAGEDLASNFTDPQVVVNAWEKSPTHNAVMTKSFATDIGVGIASGYSHGQWTTLVAIELALPSGPPVVLKLEDYERALANMGKTK